MVRCSLSFLSSVLHELYHVLRLARSKPGTQQYTQTDQHSRFVRRSVPLPTTTIVTVEFPTADAPYTPNRLKRQVPQADRSTGCCLAINGLIRSKTLEWAPPEPAQYRRDAGETQTAFPGRRCRGAADNQPNDKSVESSFLSQSLRSMPPRSPRTPFPSLFN